MEKDKSSFLYDRLSDQEKEKADAILSFLTGMNAKSADNILQAAQDEILYRSELIEKYTPR